MCFSRFQPRNNATRRTSLRGETNTGFLVYKGSLSLIGTSTQGFFQMRLFPQAFSHPICLFLGLCPQGLLPVIAPLSTILALASLEVPGLLPS